MLESMQPNHLHKDENTDLLSLFKGIFSNEIIQSKHLLKDGDSSLKELRSRIQKLGVQMQTEENDKRCDLLVPKQDDRLPIGKMMPQWVPFFQRYCLPHRISAIQSVITVAIQLDTKDSNGELNIMRLKPKGGKGYGKTLVAVTPSDTHWSLYQNGKVFGPKLYRALIGNGDFADGSQLTMYDVFFTLIKLHRFHQEAAFEDVCRTSTKFLRSFKMDPYRQIAMFQKTNLTNEQGRTMRPFLNADKCNPFHSEHTIQKLQADIKVKPVYTTFMEKNTICNAWTMPIDEVVRQVYKTHCETNLPPDEVDVLLSADHGNTSFRVNIMVIFIKGCRCVKAKTYLVGTAVCKKDTRSVLVDSGIAAAVNDALKRLKEVPYCMPVGSTEPSFWFPVKLYATGDLAWYALALGKENMAGDHCWRCLLRWIQFQKNPHQKGKKWTLKLMSERLAKLEDGSLDWKKASEAKGLKTPPLIDAIKIQHWLTPILHSLVLLVNAPFDYLQLWCWYRLEEVPNEVMEARWAKADAEIEQEDAWLALLDAQSHLFQLEGELEELKPPNTQYEDEKRKLEVQQLKAVIKAARKSVSEAETVHKEANDVVREAKRQLKKFTTNTKEYGKATQDVWMTIQRMLNKEHNVHISSYHGGDMEGNECKRLVWNASMIMADIKRIMYQHLHELPPEAKESKADKKEVDLFRAGFEHLFQYIDLLVHYAYQEYGSLTDEELDDATKAIRLGQQLWKALMPTIPMKTHAWKHHLDEDLRLTRGMQDHNEEACERSHQAAKGHDDRLRCFRDFEKN